jgi:hypothetical protein
MKAKTGCALATLLFAGSMICAEPPTRPLQMVSDVSLEAGGIDDLAGLVPLPDGFLLGGYSNFSAGLGISFRPWLMRVNDNGEKVWLQLPDDMPWSDKVALGAASDQTAFLSLEGFNV